MNGADHYLYKMMHPKSIAFWGASSNPMAMGSVQLAQLLDLGFEGPVYPMHPRDEIVAGKKAYKHCSELPEVPDLAVLILPTRVVAETLEECGKAGIKSVIIVSAGFGEAGAEGKEQQNKLVGIAKTYGMHFLGPNCIGIVNSHHKLNTTFFPYDAAPGFIGMASQSGSFITQMFVHLEKFGLGFSQGFSVGNEAMIDICDCIEYLSHCPETKVIGVYIEAIRRGRDFFRVAKEASKIKPVVAFYVGGSESGKKAALSHTGALAGPDLLYDGIFKQCGVIRAYSLEELFDYCFTLGTQPLPAGNDTAILTHSGGPGAEAADSCERNGLKLADLSAQTREKLLNYMPHTASISNPIDMTFAKNPEDYTAILPGILLEDPNIQSLFMYLLLPMHRILQTLKNVTPDPVQAQELGRQYIEKQCRRIADLKDKYGKPVVGGSFCTREEPFVRVLQDYGVPVLPSPSRAMKALSALAKYAEFRRAVE
jgi:acetate---CoA ligase (ADP-forming) subunit alpha